MSDSKPFKPIIFEIGPEPVYVVAWDIYGKGWQVYCGNCQAPIATGTRCTDCGGGNVLPKG